MGRDTVQFACHHCNHCCTEVVCLPTPWDVLRIIRATGANPYEFLEWLTPDEVSGVEEDDPTWLVADGARYIMALEREEGRGCHFLDQKTRLCSIYAHRPLLCRLYPFKLVEDRQGRYKGFTLHSDVGCPRHRDGEVPTQPLYEMYLDDADHHAEYRDLVAAFNAADRPKREPEDFLDLFVTDRIWTEYVQV